MVKVKYLMGMALSVALISCGGTGDGFVEENVEFARKQIGKEIELIEASGKFMNPTTLNPDGSVYYCNLADWRSGFFPGSVWYLYELTGDKSLLPLAQKYTEAVKDAKNIKWNHDVGFMIYCSFGNGLRLTGDPEYKEVIVEAARSLSTRFRPVAGIIQSWDVDRGWISERGWECPVIIDNMMNLELLTWASKTTGDNRFHDIAVTHANTTMENHFRDDYSCYHVVSYDTITGKPHIKMTHQGYADESAWARGQAWAIYGYTMMARETGSPEYLAQAKHIARFLMNHPNMPADKVPYWDFDAPNIPNAPRDASAAAIMASALIELSQLDKSDEAKSYLDFAEQQVRSLSSPEYLAEKGTNCNFVLKHSTGHLPGNSEVDVPLSYADYYYVEALMRLKKLI